MRNMHGEQFNYEVLKAAYDSDPKLQNLIKDFDQKTIELKSSETDDLETTAADTGGNTVSQMAQNAVDLKGL